MDSDLERQYIRALRLLMDELYRWRGDDFADETSTAEELAYRLVDTFYGTEDDDLYWPDLE